MYKNYKIFSFLFFSALWINAPLQAIGGTEVEEVLDEEIKSKGILKLQYANGSEIGTGILFQEGQGQLGLGARHCFENFNPVHHPMVAYLGEEKRNVIKIYTPPEDIDLVLFVLSSPFEEAETFPTLPEPIPDASVYEGYLYGYGSATSSHHPGSLEKSGGLCRKGKVFITPISKIENHIYFLMKQGKSLEGRNDDFISFSSFHRKAINSIVSADENENYQFNKLTLDRGYVPLRKNDPYDRLQISSSYMLSGDSGGPAIGEDNKIYGLACSGQSNFMAPLRIGLIHEVLKKQNYMECFELTLFKNKLSIGFVPGEESILYIGVKNKNFYPLEEFSPFRAKIREIFSHDLDNYFFKGISLFFHNLVKMEANTPTATPYLSQWLKKIHHYNVNTFTSLFSHRNWIEKTMPLAFQYIEEKNQMATIVNKARKPLNYVLKKGK